MDEIIVAALRGGEITCRSVYEISFDLVLYAPGRVFDKASVGAEVIGLFHRAELHNGEGFRGTAVTADADIREAVVFYHFQYPRRKRAVLGRLYAFEKYVGKRKRRAAEPRRNTAFGAAPVEYGERVWNAFD